MLTLSERTHDNIEQIFKMQDALGFDLRVAAPGIIQSVDFTRQTCTVQLAIRERLNDNGNLSWDEIPLLLDVPFIYSGGGYCVTLPISPGDDCLVVLVITALTPGGRTAVFRTRWSGAGMTFRTALPL